MTKSYEWYKRHMLAVSGAASEMHNCILEKTGKGPGIDNISVGQLRDWLYKRCKEKEAQDANREHKTV